LVGKGLKVKLKEKTRCIFSYPSLISIMKKEATIYVPREKNYLL
jgi:hypothetical protein